MSPAERIGGVPCDVTGPVVFPVDLHAAPDHADAASRVHDLVEVRLAVHGGTEACMGGIRKAAGQGCRTQGQSP